MSDLERFERSKEAQIIELMESILSLSKDVGAIPKTHNKQLRYSVRGWDDVLNVIAPLLVKHGLILSCSDEAVESYASGGLPRVRVTVLCTIQHVSGGTISRRVIASHPEWIMKGNGDLVVPNNNAEGSARTYAQRDFICRLLSIPTEETPEVSDAGSTEATDDEPVPPKAMSIVIGNRTRDLPESQRASFRQWMEDQGYWWTPNDWTPHQCTLILGCLDKYEEQG